MSVPTLDPLKEATITDTGEVVTVLFKCRDNFATQFKQMVSFYMQRPVCFIFQSPAGTTEEWWTAGTNYNPFGPALTKHSDQGYEITYRDRSGALVNERQNAPCQKEHRYGVSYQECWNRDGQAHRVGGPATVSIDYGQPQTWNEFVRDVSSTGKQLDESRTDTGTRIDGREICWCNNGYIHNPDGWARQKDSNAIEFVEVTPKGVITKYTTVERSLSFMDEQGQLHRTDGPSVIELKWLTVVSQNGKDVRWTFEDWSVAWHVRGRPIPTGDLIRWAKENHILMWHNEPCHDKPAFRDAEGELCFLTDFVGDAE